MGTGTDLVKIILSLSLSTSLSGLFYSHTVTFPYTVGASCRPYSSALARFSEFDLCVGCFDELMDECMN